MKEYKVITQNDKWFSGRFDGELLQKIINDHARVGWTVKSMCSASREGVLMGGNKDELIVLLERDAPVWEASSAPAETYLPPEPPTDEELREAREREQEVDRLLAEVDATVADPDERKRRKLQILAANS
ncbi:MAG TPA: DUF4177 domain-containing protein [Haloferula sp.]